MYVTALSTFALLLSLVNFYFIIIIIIILPLRQFITRAYSDGFSREFERQQVSKASRSNHTILAVLNNAVVSMVSTRSVIPKSFSPCTNPLETVLSPAITTGITFTFMLPSFFPVLLQGRCTYFSFRFLSVLPCSQPEEQSPLFGKFYIYIYFFIINIISGCLVVWMRLGDLFVSQNPRELRVSYFPRQILGFAYTICSYGQI